VSVNHPNIQIISGGQTGADRAALDAAISLGVAVDGWLPKGRKTEDGPLPEQYPLKEMQSRKYADRTKQNVIDSDGTLIVSFGPPTGGTALTQRMAQQQGKPMRFIDAQTTDPLTAAGQLQRWVSDHAIARLNVAGPRSSQQPEIYDFTYSLIRALLVERSV